LDARALDRFSLTLDRFDLLADNDLDVARVGHVRVDATVRAVGAAALRDGLVALDVRNEEVLQVQALGFRVATSVAQQAEERFGSLLRPAALTVGGTFALRLRGAADATAEAAEHDASLHGENVLEVLLRIREGLALEHLARFAHVLERNAEVRATRLGGLLGVFRFSRVLHHLHSLKQRSRRRQSSRSCRCRCRALGLGP